MKWTEQNTPALSVVVATYNRGPLLARNLPTILQQNLSSGSFEVVLVVDGSSDETLELLAPFKSDSKLRIIVQSNQGPAKSRQTALEHARGKIALFTDDDIRFTPDLVRCHIEAHAGSTTPVMVRGSIRVAPESPRSLITEATRRWYEEHFADFRPEVTGARIPDDFLIFANTSVPRVCIEACGGIDPNIPFPQEGFELLLRLSKSGVPLRYAPQAAAFEVYSKPTWKSIAADAGGRGRADWAVCRKHSDFRRQSVFGGLADGGPVTRTLRRMTALHPNIPSKASNVLIWLSETFRHDAMLDAVGLKALALRNRVETLHSGLAAAGSWKTLEETFGTRMPVLMYHHVGQPRASSYRDLTIEPTQFREQMDWLSRNGYTGISARHWSDWLIHQKKLPPKPVVITFDDAYADIFEHALPVLQAHGFSATVFVVTALVGDKDRWNDVSPVKSVFALGSSEQIRSWADRIEFGSHTRTHADLRALSERELAAEISDSKTELEAITGTRVVSFAYPFGFYNQAIKQLVARQYSLAFTVAEGINTLRSDPHEQRRVMILPTESLAGFARRVQYGRNVVAELRGRAVRGMRRLRILPSSPKPAVVQ